MSDAISIEQRLEHGELITWNATPFSLPVGDDLAFLLQQRLVNTVHKNISYNPANQHVSGVAQENAERLQQIMQSFSQQATAWLTNLLPNYASSWQPDRASLRTEEEATRKLRLTARNDLLHFDAFPSRPTRGHRILRLYVNINPTDDRVWMTSDTFAKVLERFGSQVGLPARSPATWARRLGQGLLSLFQPNALERTEYDDFMLRLHHFMKTNEEFQETAPRRLWHFKPNTAWLLFSDMVSHAELRGQHALEHSYFVSPQSLMLVDVSPLALLQAKCGTVVLPHAA